MMTLELGRMRTWRFPAFSALLMLLRMSVLELGLYAWIGYSRVERIVENGSLDHDCGIESSNGKMQV
jgi:hypothetical protein